MSKQKVWMTRPFHPEARALLDEHFEVQVWPKETSPPISLIKEKVGECDAIFTESYDRFHEDVLSHANALKIIANRAVGTDNLDIPGSTSRGILLSNTPGVLQDSCADFTFALILSVARKISSSERDVRDGRWTVLTQMPWIGTDVHGKTLGIVGLGGIGTKVAKRASGFDMRVIYYSRTRKPDVEAHLGVEWVGSLDEVLRASDYVSLHMPLTPETEGIIGKRELGQMKPESFLINTTRGKTVDPHALAEALGSRQIAGAATDVMDPEPIPDGHPILSAPNLVITPHIASASSETFKKMAHMAADNIIAALNGRPMPSCLNPEALQHRC